jgi:hypothetical protein
MSEVQFFQLVPHSTVRKVNLVLKEALEASQRHDKTFNASPHVASVTLTQRFIKHCITILANVI